MKAERVAAIRTMLTNFGRESFNSMYVGFAVNLLDKIATDAQTGHPAGSHGNLGGCDHFCDCPFKFSF